jgi:hypothetical protein
MRNGTKREELFEKGINLGRTLIERKCERL